MKNFFYSSLLFLAGSICCGSCSLETSDNGNLDGFWYAERIDSLSGVKAEGIYDDAYWKIQYRLLSIRRSTTLEEYFFRFEKKGDSLILSQPHKSITQGIDSLLPDNQELLPLGIQSLEERFYIVKLSGNRMILKSPTLNLHFRKL
jgi:hypothetical protein